jgi:hypothetical protein
MEGVIIKIEHGEALVKFPNGEKRWFSDEQAMLVGAKWRVVTAGRLHFEQQARAALLAHYARKGLKDGELTQTVDKVMAVQFKPLLHEEQLRKAIAETDEIESLEIAE